MSKVHFLIAFLVIISACTTMKESSQVDEAPVVIFYEINQLAVKAFHDPLPNYYPFKITWHYSDGSRKEQLGFRGWDINKDNHLDMLEVLDEAENTEIYAYDFDADGRIDYVRKRARELAR